MFTKPPGRSGKTLAALRARMNMEYLRRNGANSMSGPLYINVNSATALFVEQAGVHDDTLIVDTTNGRVGVGVAPATTFQVAGNVTIGVGTADVDYSISFDGETNDGVITWMEDEDYFQVADDILLDSTEHIYIRDTAIHIASLTDGHLDLTADVSIDLNTPIALIPTTGKLQFRDANTYIYSNDASELTIDGNAAIWLTAAVIHLSDSEDIVLGTTNGTQLGTANDQKLGFWGNTPIVRPAQVTGATGTLANVVAQFNDLLVKLAAEGLITTDLA